MAATVSASASAVVEQSRVHVDAVPEDQSSQAQAIRGRYRATLDWWQLDDGLWLLQVVNEDGVLVDGGVGDDPIDALLEVYERLIPPS